MHSCTGSWFGFSPMWPHPSLKPVKILSFVCLRPVWGWEVVHVVRRGVVCRDGHEVQSQLCQHFSCGLFPIVLLVSCGPWQAAVPRPSLPQPTSSLWSVCPTAPRRCPVSILAQTLPPSACQGDKSWSGWYFLGFSNNYFLHLDKRDTGSCKQPRASLCLSFPMTAEHLLGFAGFPFGVSGPLSPPVSLQHCFFSLFSESKLIPLYLSPPSADIPGQPQTLPRSCTAWFALQVLANSEMQVDKRLRGPWIKLSSVTVCLVTNAMAKPEY